MDGNFWGGSFPGEFSWNISDLSDEILTNQIFESNSRITERSNDGKEFAKQTNIFFIFVNI